MQSFHVDISRFLNQPDCGSKKIIKQPSFKRRWKGLVRRLLYEFHMYCATTTLHGFRYIIGKEVSRVGKLVWLTICLMNFILSVYLTLTVWNKYEMTPAVISVESTAYSLQGFPFPAVTICNFNKVYKPRVKEMAHQMMVYGMNDSEIQFIFDSLPLMIHGKFSKKDFKLGMKTLQRLGLGPESFMYNLMQPCDKLIVKCTWLGRRYDCTKIFKAVKTSEGFCCSFNYHVQRGEFPYEGFLALRGSKLWNVSEQPGIHEPLALVGTGYHSGLDVVINVEPNTYRASIRPYYGASIIIHEPIIFPEINIKSLVIQPGQELTVHVKGSLIESEQSIRTLNLNKRKCWFSDEITLNSSAEYRYESCITECRMEFIMARCQCIPFYYPKTFENVRICGLTDVQCVQQHRVDMSAFEAPSDYVTTDSALPKCRNQCLPECSDKTYALSTESAYFPPEGANDDFLTTNSYFETSNESAISVIFPDITCLKYRRETVMTWENLLAACGGIFGLCVGGSFVSLVEFIYFLVSRLYHYQATASSQNEMPIHSYGFNGKIEDRKTTSAKKLSIDWENYDFVRRFNLNKNKSVSTRDMLNRPKKDENKMAFTIDLTD